MASWLALIKSKLLIPKEEIEENLSSDEISSLLAFNLKRIKCMRDMAEKLFGRNLLKVTRFYRGKKEEKKEIVNKIYEGNTHNLIIAYSRVLNRKNEKPLVVKTPNFWTVENALNRLKELFSFNKNWHAFKSCIPSFKEVDNTNLSIKIAWATTLAASLELAKNGDIELKQEKSFGKILLRKLKIKKL